MNYIFFLKLPGALISGLSVYFILSYMLIPDKITLPLSIIISVLVFGLTNYYYIGKEKNTSERNNLQEIEKSTPKRGLHNIVFIIIYVALLAVVINSSLQANSGLFINWENITPIQLLDLTAAIAFSFFLPGYALVTVLNRMYKLTRLPKLLLAYLFSMLITGLVGYIGALLGYGTSSTSMILIGSYIFILLFSLQRLNALNKEYYDIATHLNPQLLSKIKESIRNNYSQFIVFSSLLALVIFYTYYINDGKIVVDQWYHHGRALLIGSGLFGDLGPDRYVPPFFSALLASFFKLSASPSVNAYAAIGILNIVPVFAFYYFFTKWVPRAKRRASLLASTLFMLSSGFGWLYVLNTGIDSHQQGTFDVSSSINILDLATAKTFDIGKPTTFVDVGHPDITTSLIIIALPAGFTLLGLIRDVKIHDSNVVDYNSKGRQLKSRDSRTLTFIAIITALSFVGILSHDEFFLFIISASIAIVVLSRALPVNVNYSIFYAAFLFAITLVILIDVFISPARFYTSRKLLGIPIITLSFLFVSVSWAIYLTFCKIKKSNNFKFDRIKRLVKKTKHLPILDRITSIKFFNNRQFRFLKLSLGIVIVSIVAYLYLFTVLVWDELSVNEIHLQTQEFSNVPWYLYPIKFGLTGLLGLAFILSYLFKKFEKEIFIFGIISVIAFFAGPYYDEHRFGKYIMTTMAAFAALLIYKIISSGIMRLQSSLRPLFIGISLGIVVTSSCLSIFMFAGYVELSKSKTELIEGGRRDFPTISEIQLLNFLNNKTTDPKAFNTIVFEKETALDRGFGPKIYGFTAVPREKVLQSSLTLNASTLESLINLLNKNDVGYIVLPKKDININISNVIKFILDNFPKAYEDKDYIVLQVLPLTQSTPKDSDIAFLYQTDFHELWSPISNKRSITPTDTGSFGYQTEESSTRNNSNYNNSVVVDKIESKNKNISSTVSTLTLGNFSNNSSKSISLWSLPVLGNQQYYDRNSVKNNGTIINYMEANFRIIDEFPVTNKSENKANDFAAGVLWEHNKKEYRLSISNVGLELSQRPSKMTFLSNQSQQLSNNDDEEQLSTFILSQNEGVKRHKGIWNNLKILFLKNDIEIYVNDIMRINVPVGDYYQPSPAEKNVTIPGVSRVGVSTYYSKSEFRPIILGHIAEFNPSYKKTYYSHYYPLSILALSKVKYDSFLDDDLSAFSKKYVILPADPPSTQENETKKYLEFVNNGGNLIVMNSDNNFDGLFSKLLPIKVGNLTKFSRIESSNPGKVGEKKYSIDISGMAKSIEVNATNNLTVKSYYLNKDKNDNYQRVAPFGIEKNYGKGKIIFVNVIGYFDAITPKSFAFDNKDSNNNFMTLSKVARIIGIPEAYRDVEKNSTVLPVSTSRIIGDLKILPRQTVTINSSSLLLPDSNGNNNSLKSYNLSASTITVSTSPYQKISFIDNRIHNNTLTSYITDDKFDSKVKSTGNNTNNNYYNFKKAIIKDLKLYGGPYEIIIKISNSPRTLYLPTTPSYNDYVGMSIPKGFDMIVKFPDNNSTYAQLDIVNQKSKKNSFQTIKISGNNYGSNNSSSNNTGQISFSNVKADVQAIRIISALMKSPEIKIIKQNEENLTKEQTDRGSTALLFKKNSPDGAPMKIHKASGNISIKVDHVDNYQQNNYQSINTQFVTYLKEDVRPVSAEGNTMPSGLANLFHTKLAIPGDISDYAKEHEIEIPWKETISSHESLITAISIVSGFVIVILLLWSKLLKTYREYRNIP